MKAAYIVSASRTPIGCFLGKLSKVSAIDLAATSIKGAISQISLPNDAIDEVILGNVISAGLKQVIIFTNERPLQDKLQLDQVYQHQSHALLLIRFVHQE
jgi:acetyl-CoA acetyltransferase